MVVLLAITGCSSPPPVPCMRRLATPPLPPVPLVLVGGGFSLEMRLSPVVTCPGSDPLATEAVATVLNPQNEPVFSSNTAPISGGDYVTTVTFAPKVEGVYTVIVRFEPGLGAVQRQVQAVRDRTREGALTAFTPVRPCAQVAKVGQAFLCAAGSELDVYRDGGRAEIIAGHGLVATAGPVAWTWGSDHVTRLEEVDGGFAQLSAPLGDAGEPGNAAGGSATSFASLVGSTLTEVSFDAGVLAVSRTTTALPPPNGTTGLLALPGQVFAWGASNGDICVLTLLPEQRVQCSASALAVGPSEGDVLWVRGASNNDVGVLRILSEAHEPTLTLLTARAPSLIDGKQAVPLFRWDPRIVAARTADLALESWQVGSNASRFGVAPGVVWLQSGDDNELSVFAR